MSFAKLDSGITESSLWAEALHVRIVFLSFLARKDESGFVSGSRSGLIRVCNVTSDQFDDAIIKLSSPDIESKTQEFEGRRIAKCDGGYVVLNSDKYRLPEDIKRKNRTEYMKSYMADYRSEGVNANKSLHELTPVNIELTSVSESVSESVLEKEFEKKPFTPDELNFDVFRKLYPGSKRGLETEYKNFVKKHHDNKTVLNLLFTALNDQIEWRREMAEAGMFVPDWKNLQTWINNRCWEIEKPEIKLKQKTKQKTVVTDEQRVNMQTDILNILKG